MVELDLDDIEYVPSTAQYNALTEDDDPSWGEMFQIARETYFMTRKRMAHLLDISEQYLKKIETDDVKCPTWLKQKIFTLGFPMMLMFLRKEAKEKYGEQIYIGD